MEFVQFFYRDNKQELHGFGTLIVEASSGVLVTGQIVDCTSHSSNSDGVCTGFSTTLWHIGHINSVIYIAYIYVQCITNVKIFIYIYTLCFDLSLSLSLPLLSLLSLIMIIYIQSKKLNIFKTVETRPSDMRSGCT